jgi:hypothetical protein
LRQSTEERLQKLAPATDGATARQIKQIVSDAARYTPIDADRSEIIFKELRKAVIESPPD